MPFSTSDLATFAQLANILVTARNQIKQIQDLGFLPGFSYVAILADLDGLLNSLKAHARANI